MSLKPFSRRTFFKVGTTAVTSLWIGCLEKGSVKETLLPDSGPKGGVAATDQQEPSKPQSNSAVDDPPQASIDGGVALDQNAGDGGFLDASQSSSDAAVRLEPSPLSDAELSDARITPVDRQVDNCRRTTRDITGPYWREGIPIRNDFDLYGQSGSRLTLSGFVQDANCRPIPNAVIEMWHAHPSSIAAADHRPMILDYDTGSPHFRYYGQFATDARGRYEMSTKLGWYLNGATLRPSHIHVKIYVEGTERLTTQLYFEGDPFIADDPWAWSRQKRHFANRVETMKWLAVLILWSLPIRNSARST